MQICFEDLRRLRQSVERPLMDPAGHEVVARAFGRRLDQHRGFDVEEIQLVEVVAHRLDDFVAHGEIVLHARRGANRDSGSAAAGSRRPRRRSKPRTAASSECESISSDRPRPRSRRSRASGSRSLQGGVARRRARESRLPSATTRRPRTPRLAPGRKRPASSRRGRAGR